MAYIVSTKIDCEAVFISRMNCKFIHWIFENVKMCKCESVAALVGFHQLHQLWGVYGVRELGARLQIPCLIMAPKLASGNAATCLTNKSYGAPASCFVTLSQNKAKGPRRRSTPHLLLRGKRRGKSFCRLLIQALCPLFDCGSLTSN